ncbi:MULTISPECIES: hypothetical protein [Psychromonas]|nr:MULTISPECIES: hypothetical protein [Psychromonas]MBB1274539.1 hypothetical protein [Psychromonas sp. SR45-3]
MRDETDYEKGDYDSFNSLNECTSQVLEKHLILTLHEFFKDATMHVKG